MGGYAAPIGIDRLVSESCGAQDEVGTASALQKYAEMDVQFTDTREYKLLRDIQAAQEEALPQPLLRRCTCADRARKDNRTAVHVRADGRREREGGQEDRMDARLVHSSCGVCHQGDVEAFTNAVKKFDDITKLDAWKTSVLLRACSARRSSNLGAAGALWGTALAYVVNVLWLTKHRLVCTRRFCCASLRSVF